MIFVRGTWAYLTLLISLSLPAVEMADPATRLLRGPLSWTGGLALALPPPPEDGSTFLAYKNPTVVQDHDGWTIVASRKSYRDQRVRHDLACIRLRDWNHPEQAEVTTLFAGSPYASAPCLLYFTPHRAWYLFLGWTDPATKMEGPAFTRVDDLAQLAQCPQPTPCFTSLPTTLPKKSGVRWLDFTVIGDGQRMYLFFTDDSGNFLRCSTSLDRFPRGWDDPVVVMTHPTSVLFEGSCTYRIEGTDTFLTIVEAIDPVSRGRFYTSFRADRLDGAWTPISTTPDHPFAGPANVHGADGSPGWSRHISHGELLRSRQDETMAVDPAHLTFLYQGWDGHTRVPGVPLGKFNGYHEIPYRLGLLHLDAP